MKRIGAISAAKSVIVAISHSEKVLAIAASEDVAVAVAGNEGVITLTAVEYGGPIAGPDSIIALPTEDWSFPSLLFMTSSPTPPMSMSSPTVPANTTPVPLAGASVMLVPPAPSEVSWKQLPVKILCWVELQCDGAG